MFLISEVHPFDDGNGRLARVMMNTELVAGAQSRIIIPTVFRDDYLGGLRQLTRRGDPSVLIKTLRYGHDYTARIDFSTLDRATEILHATNAFKGAARSSAEVIVEAPCCTTRGGILPLANFGTVNISGSTANGAALGNAGGVTQIIMIDNAGRDKDSVSSLSGGENFSATWLRSN